jgi:hypothetical protein
MSVTAPVSHHAQPEAPHPPAPRPGAKPCRCPSRPLAGADRVAPRAKPPLGPPPGKRAIVDGTPEVALAAAALGGLGVVAGGETLAGAASSVPLARSAGSYVSALTRAIGHSLGDPARTGEHIAEGVIGGAAWAGAAAGVAALADAARAHMNAPLPAGRP